jgi:DNA-binding response OmpR family regulator
MLRILLVEDEADQRNLYAESLTESGFEVFTARDGKEAVQVFGEIKPDAVILDIQMPGMDGIQALGHLLAKNKAVAVVFYTAYPAFKDNFITWAADAFVVKTGDPSELVREVQRVLAERGVLRLPTVLPKA